MEVLCHNSCKGLYGNATVLLKKSILQEISTGVRMPKAERYAEVATVLPSPSPNRRFLAFILVALALVTLVILTATLVPIYMTGNGEDEDSGKLSERLGGDDSLTYTSSRPSVIGVSTVKSHSLISGFINDSSSTLKESKYLHTTSVFPSAMTSSKNMYITTSVLTAVFSSADNFGQPSAANINAGSTAKSDVTTNLNNVPTSGSSNIIPSPTSAETTSGRVTISPPVVEVLSTIITSKNFITKLSMASLTSMSSSGIVAHSTASEPELVVSSLARLVPNIAAISPSETTGTKPSTEATLRDFKRGQTSPLPRMTSITSTATIGGTSEAPTVKPKVSEPVLASSVADQTVIANLSTDTAASSSLKTETKPSAKATSSNFHQGQTTSPPRMTSLTPAAATKSMSEATSIMSTMSGIRLANSVADVAVIANLVPNTESKWSRWSSWTDCTKTCGTGTRQRNRTCHAINQRAVFAPISCAGKSQQVKSCAEWSCPDCSKNCTIGTLNEACDACTCAHHSLTGRILTESDVPLSEVNISLAETPYNILTQTNVSGYFSTLGVCADDQQELLITKAGLVPVKQKANVLTPTTATIKAKLEIAVAPFVTVHPESKTRMSGQSVTFCCNGEGNPPPEIEWFKENNLIDKDLYNYDKVLEIPDVTAVNGTFRCRVVNQFGSEFSTVAELTVFEKSEDSCSTTPKSKNEALPVGCVLNGTNSTTVDVGECEPVACVKGNSNFNSSCTDSSLCCGPRSFETALIQCGALLSFNLSVVRACGCGKCLERQTMIEGKVVGQDDSAAVLVELIFAGELVDRTDANGDFSFAVPKETKRAIVTFRDRIIQKFQEEDKIFVLNEGQTVTYRMKLKEKPKPITFNASEPFDVPLGGESDSFADLELPENALLTEDGSVFSGNAKVTVSVTDPRNQSDILSAPGDFTTMNEDGEVEILETYGMVKMNLEDDNGKPLVMSKPMKVYLDPEKLNITYSDEDASVKVYWLDRKTGRWREVGDLFPEDGSKRRRKRSNRIFLAGTVTPSIAQEYINLDKPSKIVGLRVTTKTAESGVIITAIRKDHKGYVERVTNNGVTCMPIWKDNEYYLQAEKNFKYYDPDPALQAFSTTFQHVNGDVKPIIDNNGITISSYEFDSTLVSRRGPIYFDDGYYGPEQTECRQPLNSANPQLRGSQFVFVEPQPTSAEYALLSTPADLLSDWWSDVDFETCFIKVTISGTSVLFMAASYKKDDQTYTGKYGFHLRMSRTVTSGSDKVVCLQFRCPRANDHTVLLLTPMTSEATCVLTHTDADLDKPQSNSNQCPGSLPSTKGQEKWLCIPYSDSELYSTYMGFENIGEARCLRSNQRYGGTDTTTVLDSGFSVKYDCRLNDDSYKSTVRNPYWPSNGDKCYVKIKVSGRRSVFKAESYKANKTDLYGYSTDITRPTVDNPAASVTCLEYRCSDVLPNGAFSENTFITIRPILGNCKFVNTVNNFDSYQNRCPYSLPPQQGVNRAICDVPLPSFVLPIPGLYNRLHYSWQTTEGNCRVGDPRLGFLSGMFSRGYALHYNCT